MAQGTARDVLAAVEGHLDPGDFWTELLVLPALVRLDPRTARAG